MYRLILTTAVFLAAGGGLAQDAQPPTFASFAGASAPVLNDPHDLAFGPDGNLWIADKFADRIVLMTPDTLEVIGSVGDGALAGAHDISFGSDGKAYVAATSLSGVVVYDITGNAPKNEGVIGPFPRTEGVLAHSNGRLYVGAAATGEVFAVAGDQLVARARGFPGIHDVEEGPDGTVWVADTGNARVVQLSEDLEILNILSGPAYGFKGPRYLAFDQAGHLVVVDQDAHRVLLIDIGLGVVLGVVGTGEPGLGPNLLDDPEGAAVGQGAYYFSDSDNNRIVKYIVVTN